MVIGDRLRRAKASSWIRLCCDLFGWRLPGKLLHFSMVEADPIGAGRTASGTRVRPLRISRNDVRNSDERWGIAMPFEIEQLDHVEVFVRDIDAAASWYDRVFGLKVVRRWDPA